MSARLPLAALLVPVLVGGCGDTVINISSDGNIQVAVSTSGSNIDSDGFRIIIDGGTEQAVSVGGTVTLTALSPGEHSLRLTGLAGNCRVEGTNPRTVVVEADGTATVNFDVRCSTVATGTFTIFVATFGPTLDPDGYKLAVAGVDIRRIPVEATETFTGVSPGLHLVSLKDVIKGCTVLTANPLTVTALAGQNVQASFDVDCGTTVP